MVKNSPANTGDTRNVGLIPGLARSPGGGNGNHSSILAWETPRTEEPDGYGPLGCKRVGHGGAHTHACNFIKDLSKVVQTPTTSLEKS